MSSRTKCGSGRSKRWIIRKLNIGRPNSYVGRGGTLTDNLCKATRFRSRVKAESMMEKLSHEITIRPVTDWYVVDLEYEEKHHAK